MDRRSFLTSASVFGLTQLLLGCSSPTQPTLKVRLLKQTIPPQILSEFRQKLKQSVSGFKLDFAPEAQLRDLFVALEQWQIQAKKAEQPRFSLPWQQPSTTVPDLVTLGDYWLTQAIQQNLIQPLRPADLEQWSQLPARWQSLVTRDRQGQFDPQGQVWAAPYRWGSTVIAYRLDKFKQLGWAPTDWSDLWRPELRGRISLLDQPREVIGLTLKKLGYSYNTTKLEQVPGLKAELLALHQQAKLYSSKAYLQPLLLEDTWAAVGWSNDLLPILQRVKGASPADSRQLAAVVPRSGTALWADVWVRPAAATSSSTAKSLGDRWIDFCWEPQTAIQLSLLSKAASPILTEPLSIPLPADLQDNPLMLPGNAILQQSEFLQPLQPSVLRQYQALWEEVRRS